MFLMMFEKKVLVFCEDRGEEVEGEAEGEEVEVEEDMEGKVGMMVRRGNSWRHLMVRFFKMWSILL